MSPNLVAATSSNQRILTVDCNVSYLSLVAS